MDDIPFYKWYNAIEKRISRRIFVSKPLKTEMLKLLSGICENFRPFKESRAILLNESPERVFKGIIGQYGKIRGAPAFIVFVGNNGDSHVQEKVGYMGEGIILEATALNIGTCWVGASFRPEMVASLTDIRADEKIFAITPAGYAVGRWSLEEKLMTGFGRTHKRKPLGDLTTGLEEQKWPVWVKKALEAARLAPSAVNRQPWRFYIEPEEITVSVDNLNDTFNIPKRLDCGIAMLHIEVASLHCGVRGEWELLEPPLVARFKISTVSTRIK